MKVLSEVSSQFICASDIEYSWAFYKNSLFTKTKFSSLRSVIFAASVCLINFMMATFVFANEVKLEPDPNCPLDYFYRGYDLVKGNPASGGDPGWKAGIMSEQSNKQCFTCTATEICEGNYTTYQMETELDYYTSLTEKIEIAEYSDNFLYSTAFTGSAEYQYQQEDIFGMGLVNVQAQGYCQIYDGLRDRNCYDLVFLPGFLNAVVVFPSAFEDPQWFEKARNFFMDYGTHVISSNVSLGARFNYQYIFTQVSYDGLRAMNIDIDIASEITSEWYRTNGVSADYETAAETEMRIAFDGAKESVEMITVGALPPTDISFGEWAENIDNPIPQSFRLSPISELFTKNLFPDDPYIDDKREIMEAAYYLYCESVPGCHEPKRPIILNVHETQEGLYESKNSLSISCPLGYTILSGGCQSEKQTEPDNWIIASVQNEENNTYSCIVSRDSSSPTPETYYKGLTVSAVCVDSEYLVDAGSGSCQGPQGQYGSECMSFCPAGYYLTGGDCESDAADESRPWKVSISRPVIYDGKYGWHCKVAEDAGSNVFDQKAMGKSLCVRFKEDLIDYEIQSGLSGDAEPETNGIIKQCRTGFEVLGGGCAVAGQSRQTNEWKLIESQPTRDNQGWSCLGQRDWGSSTVHQEVETTVLCAAIR